MAAREKIVHYMTKHKIDILIISETKVNQNSKEVHDDYTFIYSSGVTDAQKEEAEKEKANTREKRAKEKAKAKANAKATPKSKHEAKERQKGSLERKCT